MTPDGSLTYEALRPDLLADWLAFFDGPAFADNPDWGGCYCRVWVHGVAPDPDAAWDRACASGENRRVMAERVAAGEVDGILARRDGIVVGWLHFGPAERFCSPWGSTFSRAPGGSPDPIGEDGQAAVACFVIAAPARGAGVARGLLRAALDEMRRRGFTSVTARAAPESLGAAEQFTGPMRLYSSEGFEVVRSDPRRPFVHRRL